MEDLKTFARRYNKGQNGTYHEVDMMTKHISTQTSYQNAHSKIGCGNAKEVVFNMWKLL